jgi:hypothetical protein
MILIVRAIFSLNIIKQLILVIGKYYVLSEERTGFLNIIQQASVL